jgi:hypothetical protein
MRYNLQQAKDEGVGGHELQSSMNTQNTEFRRRYTLSTRATGVLSSLSNFALHVAEGERGYLNLTTLNG